MAHQPQPGCDQQPPQAYGTDELNEKVWRTMLDLSPVALLDHWRAPLMAWCREKGAIALLGDAVYPVIGNVTAIRVSLSDHFIAFVSNGVRTGSLTT
jgi:hypothetical protein